jgi:hypothetical protein
MIQRIKGDEEMKQQTKKIIAITIASMMVISAFAAVVTIF